MGDQAPSLRHSCATCIGVRLTQRLLFPTSAPSWVCEWNPKAFSLRSAREAGPCVSLTQGRSYPFAVSTAIRIPSLKKEKKRICRDPAVSPICFLLFKHNRSLRAGGGGGGIFCLLNGFMSAFISRENIFYCGVVDLQYFHGFRCTTQWSRVSADCIPFEAVTREWPHALCCATRPCSFFILHPVVCPSDSLPRPPRFLIPVGARQFVLCIWDPSPFRYICSLCFTFSFRI